MTTESKTNKERPQHTTQERAQAVLAIWTESRRPAEVCQELSITPTLLGQWQERALTGMLSALTPRRRTATERGPLLNAKLERLLTRQAQQHQTQLSRLEKRLSRLQEPKPATLPATKA